MIVRVTDPRVFAHPIAREFFLAAAKEFSDPQAAVNDLAAMVIQSEIGCFVELGPDGPKAVIVVCLPQSAFMECPQVMIIYGTEREATKAVVEAGLKFARDAGYNRGWGINRTGRPDEALERLFGHVGFVRPIGSVMEYEF